MTDANYYFCVQLHESLKDEIRGKVYTTIDENLDKLIIRINSYEAEFLYEIDNFSSKFIYGEITCKQVTETVICKFKKFITAKAIKRHLKEAFDINAMIAGGAV